MILSNLPLICTISFFSLDVLEGPQASISITHMEGGIVWKTLNVRGSWNKLSDGENVIHTYSYLVF